MAQALTAQTELPADAAGVILPLRKSLGSQEFKRHQATVAFELEVLAKKVDRFGWERDRNSPAHDRLVLDWIAALSDYPLSEVQAACRVAIQEAPSKMPNEGRVLNIIRSARKRQRAFSEKKTTPEPEKVLPDAKTRAAIMAKNGFKPKAFPKIGEGNA